MKQSIYSYSTYPALTLRYYCSRRPSPERHANFCIYGPHKKLFKSTHHLRSNQSNISRHPK